VQANKTPGRHFSGGKQNMHCNVMQVILACAECYSSVDLSVITDATCITSNNPATSSQASGFESTLSTQTQHTAIDTAQMQDALN
jgi:hypothetical protein